MRRRRTGDPPQAGASIQDRSFKRGGRLLAHLRHASRPGDYPLFGQDRKSLTQRQTDANDPKRISEAQPLDSAHDPADLNEREAGDPWGNGRPNAFDQQRPSPPRASRDRSSPDKLIGANAMRSFLALSLLMILCASASAATVHHTIPRHCHHRATSCHRSSWPRVPGLRRSGLGLRSASACGSLRRHTELQRSVQVWRLNGLTY